MAELKYVEGDATDPQGEGRKVIAHCCNDIGGWGRGFVVALSKRWKEPEEWYRNWFAKTGHTDLPFELGSVLFVLVEPRLQTWVANIIGQHNTHTILGVPPIRYEALTSGFHKVRGFCKKVEAETGESVSVHMPRIGAGLAGGNWETIEKLIQNTLVSHGIGVTVYDLPGQPFIQGANK